MDDPADQPDNGTVRTQEQRDEQTLVITSMVIGPALFLTAPLLFMVILALALADVAQVPYIVVFAAYFVVVAARLLTRGRH